MSATRLQDVRFFEGARNVFIANSAFHVETTKPSGFDVLKHIIAPSAFHNSGECYDLPRCHPRTREALLRTLMSWVCEGLDRKAFVFWLNGSVGVGKSAIGRTIAEMCERERLLLSSFFFSRSDPTRNNAKLFVTTLAYQVALAVPPARRLIEQAFEDDPVIHTRSLEAQMMKLVIEPLKQAAAARIYIPPLIVVDGLDECVDRSMQCKILDIVHRASISLAAAGRRLIFLVGSRPEQEISLRFDSASLQDITICYTLGDSDDSDHDIRRFLDDGFSEIKKSHPLKSSLPSSWPNSDNINELVWRASGQFLYAHIVIDYTRNIRHRPIDRLSEVLALFVKQANNPFKDLDVLYTHILSSVENVDRVLEILGLHFAKFTSKGFAFSDIVHDRLGLDYEDVKLLFGDLSSVVDVVTTPERGSYTWKMNLQHASLEEFLTNQHRSRQFFVNVEPSVVEWVSWVLQNDLVDHPQHVDDLELAFRRLKSCKSQEFHNVLRDYHLGFLLSKPSLQACAPIGDLVYFTIAQIQMMAFKDSQLLYESQLRVFESQVQLVLGKLYSQPAYTPLLLNDFTTTAYDSTGAALCYMLGVGGTEILPDPLGLRLRWAESQQWLSFLSAFVCDPKRSLQFRVNADRLADAALALIQILSHPVSPTGLIARTLADCKKSLRNRAWITHRVRHTRLAPGKWFKWRFCDLCWKARTPKAGCHGYHEAVPTLAYRASPRSPLIILHSSSELLAYRLALTFLSDMLAEASRSTELIECCRECVFHPTSILFPRKAKIARRAMLKYLERMEAEERGWWLD
ncbi:unnamed protein product [Cyclocybe aegerita]|uniref:Nephrocystin 3-like N-terminal domain-containing protein n=1 Tax=Cyclocybe aegerita TaxID=1973307 RepID=A0A8S0W6B4_CYCAE|nr:unnamed protein product [Cyclocybe aegerita]